LKFEAEVILRSKNNSDVELKKILNTELSSPPKSVSVNMHDLIYFFQNANIKLLLLELLSL
jgi:hypothetical protein